MGTEKRRTLTVVATLVTASVVVTAVLWYSLSRSPSVQPFTSLFQGQSGYRYNDDKFEGGCTVIRMSSQWLTFWGEHTSTRSPKPPVPPIDFEVYIVLGCFLGWQSSGGPRIEIDRIVLAETSYIAHVRRDYTRNQLPVITNPSHVVRVPATQGSVLFLDAATGEQIPEFVV